MKRHNGNWENTNIKLIGDEIEVFKKIENINDPEDKISQVMLQS